MGDVYRARDTQRGGDIWLREGIDGKPQG